MQREDSKYRRMLKRLPEELRIILDALNSKYTVESYNPQYMGWASEIDIEAHRFTLVAECKRIFVSEIIDGVEQNLSPKDGEDISYTTDSVAQIINYRIA